MTPEIRSLGCGENKVRFVKGGLACEKEDIYIQFRYILMAIVKGSLEGYLNHVSLILDPVFQ